MTEILWTLIVMYTGSMDGTIVLDADMRFSGFETREACETAGYQMYDMMDQAAILNIEIACVRTEVEKTKEST
jgi:hypothetical protein